MTGTLPLRLRAFQLLAVLPALLAGALLCAAPAAGADEKPTKLERQIAVMEKIIDEMLIESPNFLVGGSHETRGFEMEDYGVAFMFDASLTSPWWDEDSPFSRFNFWPFSGGKGRTIVINKKGDDKQKEIVINGEKIVIREGEVFFEDEDGELKKLDETGKDGKKLTSKEIEERQAKKYESGKDEMIDALLECGTVLRALPAGQMVKIVAHLDDVELAGDREVRRLTVQAKIDDLKSYAEDRLSEEQVRARIQVKES